MFKLRNIFFRQVFSLNVQHFEFETCVVTVRFLCIFNHGHVNIKFESRDGRRILFVMSPGPQPTSIHIPDIFFKSLVNSFITIDTARFCISFEEMYFVGFAMFDCLHYYMLRLLIKQSDKKRYKFIEI
ncbi:hypothetical protein ALC56_11078 [Trachymyrmex septentrionalis]|uniref:Uncharacterized protein n=1 Tax=Trachymyrmex septentrionalis TaxID=34720 RepID=A0A195F1Y7_9HYME|nr:hypothetical protein ALC56_11078 [Trachymyrmex septentrionalis]